MGEEEEEDVEGEKDDHHEEEEPAANHRCVFTSRHFMTLYPRSLLASLSLANVAQLYSISRRVSTLQDNHNLTLVTTEVKTKACFLCKFPSILNVAHERESVTLLLSRPDLPVSADMPSHVQTHYGRANELSWADFGYWICSHQTRCWARHSLQWKLANLTVPFAAKQDNTLWSPDMEEEEEMEEEELSILTPAQFSQALSFNEQDIKKQGTNYRTSIKSRPPQQKFLPILSSTVVMESLGMIVFVCQEFLIQKMHTFKDE
ncbi:hypothetical protein E2C01_003789 [Portunus trituberculatus]|uniref:Uncharacterized protein n=1 Tax=Portunus trituberculatus TaxID=210409 RepID=A0A5B7CQP6_PORTR|nr:hypothetical protein [Portunus trituberculatus]